MCGLSREQTRKYFRPGPLVERRAIDPRSLSTGEYITTRQCAQWRGVRDSATLEESNRGQGGAP